MLNRIDTGNPPPDAGGRVPRLDRGQPAEPHGGFAPAASGADRERAAVAVLAVHGDPDVLARGDLRRRRSHLAAQPAGVVVATLAALSLASSHLSGTESGRPLTGFDQGLQRAAARRIVAYHAAAAARRSALTGTRIDAHRRNLRAPPNGSAKPPPSLWRSFRPTPLPHPSAPGRPAAAPLSSRQPEGGNRWRRR